MVKAFPSLALLGSLGSIVAACGSSSQPISAVANSGPTTSAIGRNIRPPAAAGLIAAVTPTEMQVQSTTSGEVTVTWNPATKFNVTSVVSLSGVTVGSCVRVITISGAARSVDIISAPGSACKVQQPHRLGGRRRTNRAGFGLISGSVTSISPTSIGIKQATSSGTATTISLTSSTRVTQTATGTSSNLNVGNCVVVRGSTSSIGTVTANAIAISPSVSGTCVTGGRGGGGFGGSGGAGG